MAFKHLDFICHLDFDIWILVKGFWYLDSFIRGELSNPDRIEELRIKNKTARR